MSLLSDTRGTPRTIWALVQLLAAHDGELERAGVWGWMDPFDTGKDDQGRPKAGNALYETIGAASSLSLVTTDTAAGTIRLTESDLAGFGDWVHNHRRVSRRTPGRFRTRVITEGVTPSLYVDYKHSRIKQYHKEGQALRTETTINDTRDFALGRRLHNLAALRQVGFTANQRLLDAQTISHDCALGEADLQRHQRPVEGNGQRGSALRFADGRVQALLQALLVFVLLPRGFSSGELRAQLAPLLGLSPSQLTSGRLSYDLRRLRLHGLIQRLPGTHRYQLTKAGLRTAIFYTRVYQRILRPGLSLLSPQATG